MVGRRSGDAGRGRSAAVCPPSLGADGRVAATLARPATLASLIFASDSVWIPSAHVCRALCGGLRGLFKHTPAAAVSSAHLDVNRSQ